MGLYFSRNTKVFLQQGTTGTIWEIPVLDGFSFSQGVNSSEISLTEAVKSASVTKSRRSRRVFNDSYAPAEWSFSTYARPFQANPGETDGWEAGSSDANHHAVEEALWANFVCKASHTESNGSTESAWTPANSIVNTTSNMTVSMVNSEVAELGEFTLFFQLEGDDKKVYKIAKCCVNEATIDFDVDGITVINWSGFGNDISNASDTQKVADIKEEISSTDNYVRNRLTKLTITANDADVFPGNSGVYSAVLTGGSISFNNNISYLTAETLGRIDKPLGHVTGTRQTGGNFTAYLDGASNSVATLMKELIDNDKLVTNSFKLEFEIGGTATPNVKITMPQCHLEIPTHSIEDVISLDVTFNALTSSYAPTALANFDASIVYTGNANPS